MRLQQRRVLSQCEFKSLLLHLQSGFGSVTKLQWFVCEGVLTVALAQILARQLSCELGTERGVLLSCRQAVRLCGVQESLGVDSALQGSMEGERLRSQSRQRWGGHTGAQSGAEEGELSALLLRVSALGLSECRGGEGRLHDFREGNL